MPEHSVWVGASAGSGKTKVLTDRVLRLLLPRKDGQPGTPPHKIICITFTKAAAAEMSLRLGKTLRRWTVMPEDGPSAETLKQELAKLLGHEPSQSESKAARRLFADIMDAPGGLQIMTIHAFCQSVLNRFPLEADLPPNFTVLEERQAQALLAAARDDVLKTATGQLADAVSSIAAQVNDDQFLALLSALTGERYQLQRLLKEGFGADGLYAALCRHLSIPAGKSVEDLLHGHCEDEAFDAQALRRAARVMIESKNTTDQDNGEKIAAWLAAPENIRMETFWAYKSVFLTNEGAIRKKFPTKAVSDHDPAAAETILQEAGRLLKIADSLNAAACADLTRALLILGAAIIDRYQDMKAARAVLDFDDLITLTLKLLRHKNMAGWVQYKLDQGIDHILIDEAQDTNPEQWAIIEALSAEFMAGEGARDVARSIFTVGDEKQSIYSFQRASPLEFRRMHKNFTQRLPDLQNVDLNISFRSAPVVLKAVDAVFAPLAMRQGLGLKAIEHVSFRTGQEGRVELWPLQETAEPAEKPDPWDPPVVLVEQQTAAAKLAASLAAKIKSWLDKNEMLQARGRPVQPGDILILFRTRGALFQLVARALKTAGIPVSGVDRMILNEQIAVQDMLALAGTALLPTDDLTLASVLKSPLFAWNDDKLYTAAHNRRATLWEALKNPAYRLEYEYLENLIKEAGSAHPYEFFAGILQRPCPADPVSGLRAFKARLGGNALDPLDELLNAALAFERDNIPALQHFLHWQSGQGAGIKREGSESGNEVRLMTVHGSKGLQSPIVILPDTLAGSAGAHADRRILWPDKSGLPAPFWCPRSDMACRAFEDARAVIAARAEEEQRRLLYVAMTRAEDRLYIGGYARSKNPHPDEWYFAVKAGLESLADIETLPDGTLRLSNGQIRDPDRAHKKPEEKSPAASVPAFLQNPAPPEPAPPRPLAPSRPAEAEPPAQSPLAGENARRFRRGNLTHKLLQYLPELPQDSRAKAARGFLDIHAPDLEKAIREDIARETMVVLNHKDFAPIFGPGSQAEVPLAGLAAGQVISAQIDRLLVTDDEVFIIDYKTNRPPPQSPGDVPALYRKQLEAYAAALRDIYPQKTVRCALLWTDGPLLMELDF